MHGENPVGHSECSHYNAYDKQNDCMYESKELPSALLCTVDAFAIGAMRAAKDMGLSVPDDVSVIGIDDMLLSRYVEPPLTTVGIDKVGIGELAMEMLFKKINGDVVESVLLPMELIERESVKAI